MDTRMEILTARTARELRSLVNESGIKKEDIISLLYVDKQFLLFYYQ